MKIAIDVSPLRSGHYLQHRVRGTGYYLTNLKKSLLEYFSENNYMFFNRGESVDEDTDIVHYPYFEPFFLTLPIISAKKTIVTVHDLTPLVFKDKFPSGLKGNIKWNVQKRLLARADVIITDSIASREDIHKYAGIPVNKISVVYLAAAEHFKKIKEPDKKIIKKYNLPFDFLLYVGDVTWNKNLPNLIKAVNKTEFPLVIVGSAFANEDYDKNNSWNKDLYEAQILAKGNKNILPLGFIPDEDLVELYNQATALIMPSFYEGFGLPVLEAMQSGCPVITTREGSIKEVADSAAYFVDPYDVNSITNGIKDVMTNNDLRKALSQKGLKHSKNFSWKNTADGTIKVYEKILNG